MVQKSIFPALYYQIVEVINSSGGYLVGGAVRDILLSKPVRDLDFALPGRTYEYARKVADRLGGDFYILDQERKAARVLLHAENGQRLIVDFTLFQNGSIESDLRSRDFTITSMAMDILEGESILDLFGGAQDLKDGVIRATTENSILDDPLRCLRAVRMAAQFQLRIQPETLQQIHQHQHLLGEVSPERIRDELFQILAGPQQSAALMTLSQLGTLNFLFPMVVTPDQQKTIRWLEVFWSLLTSKHDQYKAANLSLGVFVHRLGRYRKDLQTHLDVELVPGRTIYQLSFLAALLISSQDVKQSVSRIQLSNQEIDRLQICHLAAGKFLSLIASGGEVSPLEVYRFFRKTGSAGIEGIFLGLAEVLGTTGANDDDQWLISVDTARTLLEGWWEKNDQLVVPPVLLTGHDLQSEFSLDPGPLLGQMLEELREAQVSGSVKTREQALDLIRLSLSAKDLT